MPAVIRHAVDVGEAEDRIMMCHICSFFMVCYPAYHDICERKINLMPAFCLWIFGSSILLLSGEREVTAWVIGMLPGIFMCLAGKLFGNCIGAGDGLLIAGIGALEGAAFVLRLLVIAGILIFAFSIVMMSFGKLHRKSQVACVPFLIMGYVGAWMI